MNNIYIGPNVKKFGLVQYQVFLNGLPDYIYDLMQKYQELELLICDTDEFLQKVSLTSLPGTIYYKAYEKLKDKKFLNERNVK